MENENKNNSRLPKYILIGLVGMQVVIMVMMMFGLKGRGGGGEGNSSSLLPIWIAIFIPIIVASRKREQTEKQKRLLLWGLVILAGVVLLGMTVFLLRVLG